MKTIIWLTCLAVACSKPATVAKVEGVATLNGKSVNVVGCAIEHYGEPPRTSIVVELDGGLRYMASTYGPRVAKDGGSWEHPTCSRVAFKQQTGDEYAVGTLGATCTTHYGELVIDATFACGVVDRPPPKHKE